MRLGNRITNPGELRTRVLFQTATLTKDAGGAQIPAYVDLDAPLVKWVNAHGPETVSADASKAIKRATVTRRYHSGVSEISSIVKDGLRWQVVSVDDIQERHEYLELQVECAKGTV